MYVTAYKCPAPAVLQEVVRKTDGVPLFVEELVKTVLELGLLLARQADHYECILRSGIPAGDPGDPPRRADGASGPSGPP